MLNGVTLTIGVKQVHFHVVGRVLINQVNLVNILLNIGDRLANVNTTGGITSPTISNRIRSSDEL